MNPNGFHEWQPTTASVKQAAIDLAQAKKRCKNKKRLTKQEKIENARRINKR